MVEAQRFDLAAAYAAKQNHMITGLGLMPTFTNHPGTKGDATEDNWRAVLDEFLPARYGVGSAFVIDSTGGLSEQIDIAIFDRQYSPLFFEQNGVNFIPVESVYAVCEVKPVMNKANLDYARGKIASVRALHRTSMPVRHAGGEFPAQDPASKPILGVFLSTAVEWTEISSEAAQTAIAETTPTPLDLGVAVQGGAFDRTGSSPQYSPQGQELIWFASRLFRALARLGTVLAIDFDAYYGSVERQSGLPSDELGKGAER
ncbi:DUF6602 domain-containing protein [Microbacterium azadirachtae]|uniref:DUF6602 domain-containing protein n=1 Tax=Microbacterium azadirachtae TaxID=582680 RepID=UPI0008913FC5|nr:DUF6602 domain-containing protein [Microbacterium azadirachtae]SDM18262.1 hypothetical protein SAMN04488593_2880 [Microbacterium azadirachtae]SEG41145.1 hypothetical protein SAMN04488594_2865 [Microbacterium azadirachtae]SEG44128.1 hypothetical protein SAMN04488592_2874 [Microbacterium azadirachtae]